MHSELIIHFKNNEQLKVTGDVLKVKTDAGVATITDSSALVMLVNMREVFYIRTPEANLGVVKEPLPDVGDGFMASE